MRLTFWCMTSSDGLCKLGLIHRVQCMIEAGTSENRAALAIPFLRFVLLAVSILFPAVLSAQSRQPSSSAPAPALNEQQRAGKILFLQNCSFCHSPKNQNPKSTAEGKTIGPLLKGIFAGQNAKSEQTVRTVVLKGVQQKMPGFQYGLEPKEIDSILAYLKTL